MTRKQKRDYLRLIDEAREELKWNAKWLPVLPALVACQADRMIAVDALKDIAAGFMGEAAPALARAVLVAMKEVDDLDLASMAPRG